MTLSTSHVNKQCAAYLNHIWTVSISPILSGKLLINNQGTPEAQNTNLGILELYGIACPDDINVFRITRNLGFPGIPSFTSTVPPPSDGVLFKAEETVAKDRPRMMNTEILIGRLDIHYQWNLLESLVNQHDLSIKVDQ